MEGNAERRRYYELLWEVGAAQTDDASLQAENIDWQRQTLQYRCRKTGEWACLQIEPKLTAFLKQLPAHGPLFPAISETRDSARAAEFRRRCRTFRAPSTLQGFLGLVDDHPIGAIERAAQRAFDQGVWRLQDLKVLLKEPSPQLPLAFLESHSLIRDLDQYAELTPDSFHNP